MALVAAAQLYQHCNKQKLSDLQFSSGKMLLVTESFESYQADIVFCLEYYCSSNRARNGRFYMLSHNYRYKSFSPMLAYLKAIFLTELCTVRTSK